MAFLPSSIESDWFYSYNGEIVGTDFHLCLSNYTQSVLLLSPDYVLTFIRYTSLSEAYGSRSLNKAYLRYRMYSWYSNTLFCAISLSGTLLRLVERYFQATHAIVALWLWGP